MKYLSRTVDLEIKQRILEGLSYMTKWFIEESF